MSNVQVFKKMFASYLGLTFNSMDDLWPTEDFQQTIEITVPPFF